MSWLARPSTRRRFRLSELITFDHSPDAYAIGGTLRNFFYAHHSSLAADKCIGSFPWRHDRKANFHPYAEPPAAPEVKTVSRNITCRSQNRLELLEVGLEPDFNRKR